MYRICGDNEKALGPYDYDYEENDSQILKKNSHECEHDLSQVGSPCSAGSRSCSPTPVDILKIAQMLWNARDRDCVSKYIASSTFGSDGKQTPKKFWESSSGSRRWGARLIIWKKKKKKMTTNNNKDDHDDRDDLLVACQTPVNADKIQKGQNITKNPSLSCFFVPWNGKMSSLPEENLSLQYCIVPHNPNSDA